MNATILEEPAATRPIEQLYMPLRKVIAVGIGNALEFYDFVTFSFFAVQIGHCFFPESQTSHGLLHSFATFGVGFLIRPVGAIVIGICPSRRRCRETASLSRESSLGPSSAYSAAVSAMRRPPQDGQNRRLDTRRTAAQPIARCQATRLCARQWCDQRNGRLGPVLNSPTVMDSRERKVARRDQVTHDLDDLNARIKAWLDGWSRSDSKLGRHQTQLGVIKTMLQAVMQEFSSRAQRISVDLGSGQVYDECRKLSEAIVGLERLWEFIRVKLDQRIGDGSVAVLLQAADEVAWSCYRTVMKRLPAGHPAARRSVLPLTYIEPEYSPAASQFDRPLPPGLRFSSADPTLGACLQRIPLPTLRLPPWCVSAPWWLVLIGHEIGHHIQHELGLVADFAGGLSGAARAAGLPEGSARRWEAWSEEIFADACCVFTVGSTALRAITELEWSTESALGQRKVNYPAPAIRIALMTRLAGRLGLEAESPIKSEELEALAGRNEALAEDWRVIEGVLDVICGPLPNGLGDLSTLFAFDAQEFARRARIAVWSEALRGIGPLEPRRETNDARHMASAAMSAWSALVIEPNDDKRGKSIAALAAAARDAIRACGENVRRAAPGEAVEIKPEAPLVIAAILLGESPAGVP